ncbi:hypothetical protein RI367_007711 [Sorochytrium milnesiophthora]
MSSSGKRPPPPPPPPPGKKAGLLNIGQAGILDLKAEVFRTKQLAELRGASSSSSRNSSALADKQPTTTKLDARFIDATSAHKKRTKERLARELDRSKPVRDDAPSWNDMRAALERKERIYQEMKRRADDDGSERVGPGSNKDAGSLVDFVKKRYDDMVQGRDSDSDEDNDDTSRKATRAQQEEDEMVEIMDEFGRMRRVPKTEAHLYMDQDDAEDDSGLPYEDDTASRPRPRPPSPPALVQHFDTKQEVRTMGTGFYRFSLNDGERSQQLADLRKLREQTIEMRRRAGHAKDRRREAVERRVRMIMQRRIAKLGNTLGKKVRWTIDVSGILGPDEWTPPTPLLAPVTADTPADGGDEDDSGLNAQVDDFLSSLY